MTLNLTGKVDGRRIELQDDPGLPAGLTVTVQIDSSMLSLDERKRRIFETCGAWKDDAALWVAFDELAEARRSLPPRYINFDAPS
jgi:hypothetical protein